MRRLSVMLLTLSALVLLLGLPGAQAQQPDPAVPSGIQAAAGTAFTYQGRLNGPSGPVNGSIELTFRLYDAAADGTLLSAPLTQTVTLVDGLFTTQLDFGQNVFTGDARWLEIAVAGTTLTPRQALTPAPYALALPGLYTQQTAGAPNIIGGWIGNTIDPGVVGAAVSGGGADGQPNRVTDNYGTIGGGLYNQAGDAAGSPADREGATVGGGLHNTASGVRATVGGGYDNLASGRWTTIGGGGFNEATFDYATIGGGHFNDATATFSTVGGGYSGLASAANATVGGGYNNTASADSATVGGGYSNLASSSYATLGGGYDNTASGNYATVGGGSANIASSFYSTVGGGRSNHASNDYAAVGGGYNNIASEDYATVAGGRDNLAAGFYSFAAGRRARANHSGSFVWGDSTASDVASTANNQFIVRASGGTTFYSNAGLTSGVSLPAGGGAWNTLSDRNLKANFATVNQRTILEAVAALPITRWNYSSQDASVQHIGPMAQDFYAAFGVGEGETTISTVDADGVALASIQGLYQLLQEKDAEMEALRGEVAALKAGAPGGSPALPAWLLALAAVVLGLVGLAALGALALIARRLRHKEAL